jgi:hypothetical protein
MTFFGGVWSVLLLELFLLLFPGYFYLAYILCYISAIVPR